MIEQIRQFLAQRSWWMNGLLGFCAYMTFIYMPFDLFWKPVEADQEVWFGYMFTGWAAKVTAVPHWLVYGFGFYGFWKMRAWMWPWASLYVAQVAFRMVSWTVMRGAFVPAIVTLIIFGGLAVMLWLAKNDFNDLDNTANAENEEQAA